MDFQRWHLRCNLLVQRGGMMEHLVATYGPMLLFLLIFLESAGAPMPRETAPIPAPPLSSPGPVPIGSAIHPATPAATRRDPAAPPTPRVRRPRPPPPS